MRARQRMAGLLLMAGASVALVACGSGSTKTTRTAATRTETNPPTTSATTAPALGSSSTGTSSTAGAEAPRARARAGWRGCVSGQVSVSVGQSNAGLGHLGEPVRFENVGASRCTLSGYPGAALVAPGGHQVRAKRTPNGYLGGLSPSATADPVVLLAPRQTASALLEGSDSTAAGAPCPTVTALLVTPPNSTVTARVAQPLAMCDPQIHPVVPGASGSQR